jgi:hypothetical protein
MRQAFYKLRSGAIFFPSFWMYSVPNFVFTPISMLRHAAKVYFKYEESRATKDAKK